MINAPWRPNPETVSSQKVSYTAISAATATAFGSQTYVVRIVASTDCYIRFGPSTVTATTDDMFIKAAWTPEYFICSPGQYVAAIRDAVSGTLFVTEMTR